MYRSGCLPLQITITAWFQKLADFKKQVVFENSLFFFSKKGKRTLHVSLIYAQSLF